MSAGPYFELRLYQCKAGRLADMHHRMGREVLPLFERAGVPRPMASWSGHVGAFSPLYAYMLRWESLDERFAAFGRFYADPDWISQRAASDAGDNMVERIDLMILRASPNWSDLATVSGGQGGLHELRIDRLTTRNSPEAHRKLATVDLPFLAERGASVLGAFQTWYGADTPGAVSILGWPDAETRQRAVDAHDADEGIAAHRAEERARNGAPLFGTSRITLMRPAPYSALKGALIG